MMIATFPVRSGRELSSKCRDVIFYPRFGCKNTMKTGKGETSKSSYIALLIPNLGTFHFGSKRMWCTEGEFNEPEDLESFVSLSIVPRSRKLITIEIHLRPT